MEVRAGPKSIASPISIKEGRRGVAARCLKQRNIEQERRAARVCPPSTQYCPWPRLGNPSTSGALDPAPGTAIG
ncbi:hypothetical protein E2C01_007298 [Portunus trituberculatus]|uniref:Uncharacterized protein n=1 Tax=Portunus trituberculatus TaxID=210409 RepID=A0A5B7CYL6_PORTR|nr:hypothetical protein [Portunus trituberculatus]